MDNGGNVGVGTASVDVNYKITTSGGGIKAESTSQPAGYFNSSSGYGLIVNTGNVGIGTTAPGEKLHVVGNMKIDGSTGTYPVLTLTDSTAGGSGWAIASGFPNTGDLTFREAGVANHVVIKKTTGNVGIGMTAPGAGNLLDVQGGSINAWSKDNSVAQFIGKAGTSVQVPAFGFYANNSDTSNAGLDIKTYKAGVMTNVMSLTSTGNVGIGTTNPGTHALSVVGTAGLSTGTAWTSTSDQRWKNIYSELKGESLNKIMALRPVSYKWNALHDSQFGENPGLKYGFIAQEVKKVIPEMISQDAKGYYWYNPSGMEAILTGAIQEQQKQIEELKAEISELKNK